MDATGRVQQVAQHVEALSEINEQGIWEKMHQ